MNGKRVAVVGDGKMARDAAGLVLATPGLDLALCIFHDADPWSLRQFPRLLTPLGIPFLACRKVHDTEPRAALLRASPALILSVNNFSIFPPDMLGIPHSGVVNFHNGPLPDYRGLNVPSWVIFNRETRHGVTWHFVDESIDTGPIVAQAMINVDPRETAISLNFRCIQAGLDLLPDILEQYRDGELPMRPQDREQGRYYSRREIPNRGIIDPTWPLETLDAFLRALDFHPFPNTFARPRLQLADGSWVSAERGTVCADPAADDVGTVLKSSDGTLEVAVNGGRLTLFDVARSEQITGRPSAPP